MLDKEQLRVYANLFVSRRDDYAVQQDDGRYRRVGRPLSYHLLARHLAGIETLGTYVIDEQGTCRFAVFDADSADGKAELVQVQQRLRTAGIPAYLEDSRRGGHLWVFCSRLLPAVQLRRWLLPYCPAGVEFYPKQDAAAGYGSLIRLPLGVHRLTNCRYWFLTAIEGSRLGLHPTARSVQESLTWLEGIQRATVPAASTLLDEHPVTPRDAHPSLAKKPCSDVPATSTTSIAAWCASQDAVQVIGRYVQLDARGLGRCPFGEHHQGGKDSRPSLRVYPPSRPEGSCWYCYVWQQGGNLFDFLCDWHGVDAKTLWHRILNGEGF